MAENERGRIHFIIKISDEAACSWLIKTWTASRVFSSVNLRSPPSPFPSSYKVIKLDRFVRVLFQQSFSTTAFLPFKSSVISSKFLDVSRNSNNEKFESFGRIDFYFIANKRYGDVILFLNHRGRKRRRRRRRKRKKETRKEK